ncbi:DgyrCDS9942 [Dimorphilus gyrociliatus]|uniref:DgyrCDS9942 n=1 Tax=Dimorphilus gyrociliatus TaxID=2664684 RepID=A0A7I8VYY4_9ANNE|nr:DgyrCDS9942 [Dimorphilus gyrociliatus]
MDVSTKKSYSIESYVQDHIKPIERDIIGKDKINLTDIATSFSYHFQSKDCFVGNEENIGKHLQSIFFRILQNRKLYEEIKKEDIQFDKWKKFCQAYEYFLKYRIKLAKYDFNTIFIKKQTNDTFLNYLKPDIIGDKHWDKLEVLLLQKINPNYSKLFNFIGMNAKIYFAIEYRIMYILRRILEDAQVIPQTYIEFQDQSEYDYHFILLNHDYEIRYGNAKTGFSVGNIRPHTACLDPTTPKQFIKFSSSGVVDSITEEDMACFKVLFENVSKRVFGKNRKFATNIPIFYAKHLLLKYHSSSEKIQEHSNLIFRTTLINALRLGAASEADFAINLKGRNLTDEDVLKLVYGR